MATTLPLGSADRELDDSLRRVRARRRWRVALHGASTVLATAIALLLAAAALFAWVDHGTTTVWVVRLVAIVAVGLAAWWWLVRPLREHPTDAQIAHFLEDREPSLDAAVLSAVDVRALPASSGTHALDGTLASEATARLRGVDGGRRVERRPLQLHAALVAVLAATLVGLTLIGPAAVTQAARLMLLPAVAVDPAMVPGVRRLAVEPGNADIARGGDVQLKARLIGFGSDGDSAVLMLRTVGDSATPPGEWERQLMIASDSAGQFGLRLFDVATLTEYYVEAGDLRSETFRLRVTDLPYVSELSFVYEYPAYTGLPPDTIVNGGDIVAPAGTRVHMSVGTTMPASGGRMVIEGRDTVALTEQPDGTLAGTLVVRSPGFYTVELAATGGSYVRGSLDYAIDDEARPRYPPDIARGGVLRGPRRR